MNTIKMYKEEFTDINTFSENVVINGMPALRVIKKNKINDYDENTYTKVNGILFHNGVIEVKMLSRLLPDAPDFARGFMGIVFRANDSDSEFESFYVRPTNGRDCKDIVRKPHGCQYFSYPGYTFSYFREYGITKYEAPIDISLNEWFTLKAVIENEVAKFYLNEDEIPVLIVNDLKHGGGYHGGVGIFVDVGTEAFISEYKIECHD